MRKYIPLASFCIMALLGMGYFFHYSLKQSSESHSFSEIDEDDNVRLNEERSSREEFLYQEDLFDNDSSSGQKKRRRKGVWWPFKERYIICENPTCCWGYRTRLRVSKCPECGHSNVAEDEE